MRRMIPTMVATVLCCCFTPAPVEAEMGQFSKVVGVEADDMLKLRAGPDVGYRVIVGLPNGTVVRVYDCRQTGSTRWCKVALKEVRSLKGYVNSTYLQGL